MYEEKRFDWSSLILGIIFVVVSLMAFQNPGSSLKALVIYLAITAIINGLTSIFIRNRVKQFTGFKATALLTLGILEVILGIVLMFNLYVGVMALAYVFALWFVIDSIRNLVTLNEVRLVSTAYYWFSLILNIIGIFIGISLFFDPIVSMLTLSFLVGFYLMLTGIFYIVQAFIK
jgi:uncharacterized membrane protein HdeD (DUF308 family)